MTKYTLNKTYKKEDGTEVEMTADLIKGLKQPLQLREITTWFLTKYGVETPVEQEDLFKELDAHQEDNTILSRTPVQPISRVMGFYRGRLEEIGLYKVEKTARVAKQKVDADGNPIVKAPKAAKKSKRKLAEEAVEAGNVTTEEAAPFAAGEDQAAANVM